MRKLLFLFITGICLALSTGCDREELQHEPVVYEGPLLEADSVRTLYSDSGIVRVMVQAPKQFEYETGDREFPEGIYIEFYEPDGTVSSTLIANKGYLFSKESRYTGVGDVKVESLKDQKMLLTDTLHYGTKEPYEKQIYTQARVTIIEEQDTLKGRGLETSRDFVEYSMLEPDGIALFEEETEESEEEEENEDD